MAEIIFLGTGTSHGVPVMNCNCKVCCSSDPKDKRFRSSLLYSEGHNTLLIDCGPDLRSQYISFGGFTPNAVLLTHIHYDHVGGIDDLRPFSYGNGMDIYATEDVISGLKMRMPYCFNAMKGLGLPELNFKEIRHGHDFSTSNITVTPFAVCHGTNVITGYKIGRFAYITDASSLPMDTIEVLKSVDVLVINALRMYPHPTHMSLEQALEIIKIINPRRAFLTHMSHEIGLHEDICRFLPPNIVPAYDGLKIEIA